jgi:hypothetical protein
LEEIFEEKEEAGEQRNQHNQQKIRRDVNDFKINNNGTYKENISFVPIQQYNRKKITLMKMETYRFTYTVKRTLGQAHFQVLDLNGTILNISFLNISGNKFH